MAQTRENLADVMAGRIFEPVLTVTDEIFYDNVPKEYEHLVPKDRAAAAPAQAPTASGDGPTIDPRDIEGVQFYKKGKKGHKHHKNGLEMKKIRKHPHPQTVVALLYRFKVKPLPSSMWKGFILQKLRCLYVKTPVNHSTTLAPVVLLLWWCMVVIVVIVCSSWQRQLAL
jgi:hypothetical protein